MPRYAAATSVASDRSRSEIEQTLSRYGADQFMYGWEAASAVVGFRMNGRMIRFILPMPDKAAKEFTHTPSRGWPRSPEQQREAYEQAVRQRWRALALVVKAKLEAVEAGIATFEDEFLANTLLPDGSTAGEFLKPQLDAAYKTGKMPPMLPMLTDGRS